MQAKEDKDFKILIVDENAQFKSAVAAGLKLLGFSTEFATGGFHLLHLLEQANDYALIIMHEDMKDMPAEESISLIRTTHKKAALPIIFISKIDNEENTCDMILNGANEYLVKSDSIQPIIDRAKKYLSLWKNN
jgi:DNA-binding response OmpR family regulator